MNYYVLLRNSPSLLKSPKKVEEHNFFHQSQDISSELRLRTYYFMFYVKTMTVKDTMDYSFQVKNSQIKIYTATRRLKLRAGHLQIDAPTRANQGTNKATAIYNSHLRDIYPIDFLMWDLTFDVTKQLLLFHELVQ